MAYNLACWCIQMAYTQHSWMFMDIVVGLSVRPSVRLFVYGIVRWLCICWQITLNKWHKIWHADVSPSLISLSQHWCQTICFFGVFFFFFFIHFFSKVRVGAKEGGSHYWEMAVAITCGCGGYLLPLLAPHSCFFICWKSVNHGSFCVLGLKGVLVVPVSESIWACNRLQIWPTGTRFLTGEVIPGVAALKSWTK